MHQSSRPLSVVSRAVSRRLASASIVLVLALESLASWGCRGEDASSTAIALLFLLIPLSPAIFAIPSSNPLAGVAAALSVGAWVVAANFDQCTGTPPDAVASTAYWGVWFYGLFTAAVVVPVSRLVMYKIGIEIRNGE